MAVAAELMATAAELMATAAKPTATAGASATIVLSCQMSGAVRGIYFINRLRRTRRAGFVTSAAPSKRGQAHT
ncbi:MAG TPA: hypothetical protein VF604_01070 [Pyrinomonadaceae bacterium]